MKRRCPICGNIESNNIKEIHMMIPDEVHLPASYNVVSCASCGFCYADTSATEADYEHYYSNCNWYSGLSVDTLFPQVLLTVEGFAKEYLKPLDYILDIGFGNGGLLCHLKNLGYKNLFGIDPSEYSVNHLKEQGINGYCRSVYDSPECLANSMDAVLLISVLEHLLEPQLAIQQACTYLKEGGYLVISIPDYSLCDKIQLPIPSQFNQEHINYFSEKSFLQILRGKGKLLHSKLMETETGSGMGKEYNRIFIVQILHNKTEEILTKDIETKQAIERYFMLQEAAEQETREIIHDLCKKKTPLVIWGTGARAMSLLASTELAECNIVAYTDGNKLKVGTKFGNMIIIDPQDIKNYPDACIAICAMKYAGEIKERIKELGFPNSVIIFE